MIIGRCIFDVEEMDFLEIFLQLPIINKGLFPLRHKLTLKLFRKLHHLDNNSLLDVSQYSRATAVDGV